MMKQALYAVFCALLFAAGCATAEKMPAEDIEVPTKFASIVNVLRNPSLPPNGPEKYAAAKKLHEVVDLTITRETKTLNDIFYHGDAMIDNPASQERNITFNYQQGDHYIRFRFVTYRNFVLRVDIKEK